MVKKKADVTMDIQDMQFVVEDDVDIEEINRQFTGIGIEDIDPSRVVDTGFNIYSLYEPTHEIIWYSVDCRREAGTQYAIVETLKQNDKIRLLEIKNSWAKIENGLWIPISSIRKL